MHSFTGVANGNVTPMRFVSVDTTNRNRVVQSGAGSVPFGIAQRGTRNPPWAPLNDGFCAIAGESLEIIGYGDGPQSETKLELGGTVSAGQFIKPGAGGVGVLASADGEIYGAQALESGVAGELILVRAILGQLAGIVAA